MPFSAIGGVILRTLGGLEGFQASSASLHWTAVVVAVSAVFYLALRNTRWRTAAGWIALACAGQACSLQLLWVGSVLIRPQQFFGWSTLLRSLQGVFLLALLVQAVIVIWGIRRLLSQTSFRWSKLLSWRAALAFLLIEICGAMNMAPEIVRALAAGEGPYPLFLHATRVALGLVIFAVGGMNLVLAAAAIPSTDWETVVQRWTSAHRSKLPWACAVWVVIVSGLLTWFSLERVPHIPDEVAYLFEAKCFSTGHLYLPTPPDAHAIALPPGDFQIDEGNKWYGTEPAGWPFVLTVGIWAGVPWLINPLLGGIAVLLAHRFIRRLYNRDIADGTVLLMAASPWVLFLSASLMNHSASLVFGLLALVGVQEARGSGSIRWAAVAGLAFGVLLHIRPLEPVLLAAVAGVWWLAAGWSKLRIAAVATTCVLALAMAGLFLGYNKATTGDPFLVPVNKSLGETYYPGANRLGFGPDIGNMGWTNLDPLPGHGPADVAVQTNYNLYSTNFELFGWASGSLVFLFLLAVWRVRGDLLMWSLVFAIWAGLSMYWFPSGPDYAARYWYQLVVPFVVLTIRGVQVLIERLRERGLSGSAAQRVWAFVALASIIGVFNLVPWRAVDKYHGFRGVTGDVRELAHQYHFGRSLVLVRGANWPDYAAAFPLNPPTYDHDTPATVYARDLGPAVTQRLREYYSDRPVWIIGGPSYTHAGFEVIAGPVAAGENLPAMPTDVSNTRPSAGSTSP